MDGEDTTHTPDRVSPGLPSVSHRPVGVVSTLLSIAPAAYPVEHATLECRLTPTVDQTVRAQAALGNRRMFDQLPPMLLHQDPRASANKFYGGTKPSAVPDAGYVPGTWKGISRHERCYVGVALFDLNHRAHVVLVYTGSIDGKKTLVCHVHDAPLAELESQLFDASTAASAVENEWLGEQLASTLGNVRKSTGAYLRTQGVDVFPRFLVDGYYHVVRPGALPLLHLRAAGTDHERDRVEQALFAALAADGDAVPVADTSVLPFDVEHRFLTVFDTCPVPSEERYKLPVGTEAHIWQLVDSSRHRLAYRIAAAIVEGADADTGGVHTLACAAQDADEADLVEASEMARAEPPMNLNAITRVAALRGTTGVELVASCVVARDFLERVAGRLFDAHDVVLAARDIDTADVVSALVAMFRRVASPSAVLLVETNDEHLVQRMRLIGSEVHAELTSADSAARLVECPWVAILVLHTDDVKQQCAYTVNCNVVMRDSLSVTEAVRRAHGAAPAQSGPSSYEFDQLRHDLNQHLKAITAAAASAASTAPAVAEPSIPPVAPPSPSGDSSTVASLRESVAILKRLARKRCHTLSRC